MISLFVGKTEYLLTERPDQCPMCKKYIEAQPLNVYGALRDKTVFVFKCAREACGEIFLAYYKLTRVAPVERNYYKFLECKPSSFISKEFSDDIKRISPLFSVIYNQAAKAESDGLSYICGPGYRKSLEFLIKDYLIEEMPDRSDEIKSMLLGKCIDGLVTNNNIKLCAKRAAWLGNDETHYVKKWEDKDVTNMKELIDLTVHWISSEIITKRYLQEMP